jgi:hypothetical protein
VDDRRFVEGLMAAVPEAFTDPEDHDYYLEEPLPYVALGHARIWLEDNALKISYRREQAKVRPKHADVVRRFWDFVETQAEGGKGDGDMETLLAIECFEGVGWVEDVAEYLGPATRALLVDAQRWLAWCNGSIGRWAEPGRREPHP